MRPSTCGPRKLRFTAEYLVDDDCAFCKIISGKEQATIVSSWRDAIAFVPLGEVTDGHTLVVPRAHVADASSSPVITGMVATHAAQYAQALNEDYNLITSSGPAATQTIRHLHFHVVPRRKGDGLRLPWSQCSCDCTV